MPVVITINGESAGQTLAELHSLSSGLAGAVAATPQSGGEASDVEKPARTRRTTGRAGAEASSGQAISTGGERVDTANAETAKEVEKPKVVEPQPEPLTLDSVRNATTAYIEKFGLPAAKVDLTFCLKEAVGKDKISDLGDADQATLKKAVDALTAAGEAAKRFEPKAS